jgi:hypothetical protein
MTSKFTIVAKGGRRVSIQGSRTSPGCLQFEILGADRESLAVITLDAGASGAVAHAIETCSFQNSKKPSDYLAFDHGPSSDLLPLSVLGEVS